MAAHVFIILFFIYFSILLAAINGVQASQYSNIKDESNHQPYRTGYHFQPPKNWINDPNGPLVYKGIYHLFYQYNPKGAVWGNIVWAHSTSTDLINWTPHKAAIFPSQPSDVNGCWSGSTTILPSGKPAILYTGIDSKNNQVQNLAVPKNLSDPYLIEWVKSTQNPLMAPNSMNKINSSSFRDPTTAWLGPDKKWRAIIGSKLDRKGMAILYTSHDFIRWTKSDTPLHSVEGNGMWECPDFFPVNSINRLGLDTSAIKAPRIKHVLKASLDDTKHEYYTVGNYDTVRNIYIPDEGSIESDSGLRYDYGKFYASKTFFDSVKQRRILLGWVNESSSVADDIRKGWSGVHVVPRHIWLDKSGKQLIQWPVVEIIKLRRDPVIIPGKLLHARSVVKIPGVKAVQADVEISFKVGDLEKAEILEEGTNPELLCSQKPATVKGQFGPFGLLALASKGLHEYTAVFFRIFKAQKSHKFLVLMCSDQSRSSLNNDNDKTSYGAFVDIDPLHEKLSLRSLIDHSIVESFGGGGKSCITARVYPTLAIGDDATLFAFNNGTQAVQITKLKAWSMKKAKIY
jgi:beta-fructofuranosidase